MTDSLFGYAARHRFALAPIPAGQKSPIGIVASVFKDCSIEPTQWVRWRAENPGCNWAIVAGPSRLIIADIDTKAGRETAWQAWCELCASWGIAPLTPHVQTRSGGWHVFCSIPPDVDSESLRQPDLVPGLINIRAGNGFTVAPPSIVDGKPYRWLSFDPPHPAPAALIQHCSPAAKPRAQSLAMMGQYDASDTAGMIRFMAGQGAFADYHSWISAGMALKSSLGDEGFALWELTFDGTVTDDVANAKWDSFSDEPGRGLTLASLMKQAHELGWHGKIRQSAGAMFGDVAVPAVTPNRAGYTSLISGGARPQIVAPEFSEIEIADRFATEFQSQIRYVKAWGKWVRWGGRRWLIDTIDEVHDIAKQFCRNEATLYAGTPNASPPLARSLNSARTVSAVLKLAQSDRRFASHAEDWDADPLLLGVPDGVVDLRTGTLRPATPDDLITKSTAVSPAGDCPLWQQTLRRATGGDAELFSYMQKMLGYCLTGLTQEQVLHFVYGSGGNGKGLVMTAVGSIFKDYHRTTASETLSEAKSDRHPTELAALQGARLVTCSETERGRHWAETRIKQLTGGDEISARFMNQDFFTFTPTAKLLISGNYKPHLRPDNAMRRRFRLIHFGTTIPENERDPALGNKLKAEWPGILAWMIEGCVRWQREGLEPPAVVLDSTEAYMRDEAEDCISQWLDAHCTRDPKAETPHAALYANYRSYAEHAGEKVLSSSEFGKALSDTHHIPKRKDRTGSTRIGVTLNSLPPPAPHANLPGFPRP